MKRWQSQLRPWFNKWANGYWLCLSRDNKAQVLKVDIVTSDICGKFKESCEIFIPFAGFLLDSS